jgi:hypothetical protein
MGLGPSCFAQAPRCAAARSYKLGLRTHFLLVQTFPWDILLARVEVKAAVMEENIGFETLDVAVAEGFLDQSWILLLSLRWDRW